MNKDANTWVQVEGEELIKDVEAKLEYRKGTGEDVIDNKNHGGGKRTGNCVQTVSTQSRKKTDASTDSVQ